MEVALATVKTTCNADILVVDDDPDLRCTLVDMLRAEGYASHAVGSHYAAIEAFNERKWDLIITDMCLEDSQCSGLELIDFVTRADDSVPVILITGYPSVAHAVDAMKRGAVDFIAKPFNRDILLHQVQKALQERRLRLDNRRLQAEVNKTAVIEKLNRELDQRVNELYRLYSISEGLNDFLESGALFERIVNLSAEVTDAQRVAALVFNKSRQFLRVKAAIGVPLPVVKSTKIRVGDGIIGTVALAMKAQRVTRPATTLTARPGPPANANGNGAEKSFFDSPEHSGLCLPLIVGHELFGVIYLCDKLGGVDFSREDEQIMQTLIEKAGIRLENQALYEGIYSNLIDTLTSLVTTLEAKDPYTREHSQRVTDYAIGLAKYLGLSDDQIEMINFAGMLHDIGKIGVHDEILTKCGRLNEEEYKAIKMHPIIGERIVKPLGLVPEERSIIRYHHERYDGRGYPDGLAGEQIPLLARIVAVTDAFDAMTSTRSYRKALPVDVALQEMQRCAGTQFDAEIVRYWIEAVEQGAVTIHIPNCTALSMMLDMQ